MRNPSFKSTVLGLIRALGYLSDALASGRRRRLSPRRNRIGLRESAEASWRPGSQLEKSDEIDFIHGFENYRLDRYWSDRMTWALQRRYEKLDHAEFYVAKVGKIIDVLVRAYVDVGITNDERERLFREWKRESEIYCKSSDEFLVTMKNNRRQGIEITSRLNLVAKPT